MEENRFFKLVWRFNGLVIMIAGLLAVMTLLFVAYQVFNELTKERAVHNIVNVDEGADAEDILRLGYFEQPNSDKVLMIPVQVDQSYDQDYFSKSATSTRNYLFVNTESGEKKWLFKHANYLIASARKVRLSDDAADESAVAIVYQVVKEDSDQDGRLSASDLSVIAITAPDGSDYQEVVEGVEFMTDHALMGTQDLFLIYRKAGVLYSLLFDLEQREIRESQKLPAMAG
ncbi:hypothetical protein [Marinobacterium marinum]|uniref:EF-hand domain-containing protein n=1 Tax=Marinobacterium marinum TaxID=2756129 RepID=A0A7W1WYI9_9GAMM|nr:hypothetical protein [Marinobacterium marinum]MBA4502417.1 hypothetical protein [Marinobacterium marinum]